jgi:hypothetical protein
MTTPRLSLHLRLLVPPPFGMPAPPSRGPPPMLAPSQQLPCSHLRGSPTQTRAGARSSESETTHGFPSQPHPPPIGPNATNCGAAEFSEANAFRSMYRARVLEPCYVRCPLFSGPWQNRGTMHMTVLRELLHPRHLMSCPEILARPCPVIQEPDVYAWHFRQVPGSVPIHGCHTIGEHTLLYIGISPCRPPKAGSTRRKSLRRRVRYHACGNAEGSTLRLSLGCLSAHELGIELRRVGSGDRTSFTIGERKLSAWMAENARVADEVSGSQGAPISAIRPLVNIDQSTHPFTARLSAIRCAAKARARVLPIWSEHD